MSACAGRKVTTIEGLTASGRAARIQAAWVEHQVPQCGFCQSGMIVSTVALLESNATPSDDDIATAVTNICRCGTYPRIRRAIKTAATGEPA